MMFCFRNFGRIFNELYRFFLKNILESLTFYNEKQFLDCFISISTDNVSATILFWSLSTLFLSVHDSVDLSLDIYIVSLNN